MILKKILLIALAGFYYPGFSQQKADVIGQYRLDSLTGPDKTRYKLVELTDNAPRQFLNTLLLGSARKLNDRFYIVDQSSHENLLTSPFILRSMAANNNWKLSPAVNAIKSSVSRHNQVYLFSFLLNDLQFADTLLQNHPSLKVGATLLKGQQILCLKVNYNQVEELLIKQDAVIFIDALTAKPAGELGTPGFDPSVNKVNVVHGLYPGIDGTGMHVSVKEDFYDTTDIDLKGRLDYSPLASKNITNHANFMATIIAGAGNSAYYAKGVAWAAQVSSSSFEQVLPDAADVYLQNDITVQNHSYGTVIDNNYGLNAMAFDKSANENDGLLHVFSSGNTGAGTDTTGYYAGIADYANLTGNFKMAKNILTVGAVDSFSNVAPLSSAGPAYDGRIKPDLVAFQQNGTSEAAALVSGTALLLQQYYGQLYAAGKLPSALAKAILINTADDAGAPGPDFKTGFGNMNAAKAMDLLKKRKIFSGDIKQDSVQVFGINVPANVSLLKVTLAWNDTAANPMAGKALVNDLDLEVLLPATGASWKPWVLNSTANADSLAALPTRQRDSLNNVEQVTIGNPVPGTYQIKVKGYNLVSDNQKYHVAYSWDSLNYFKWQQPTHSDFTQGGKPSTLRWENSFSGNGSIEYRAALSNEWQPVSGNADLQKNYYYWNVPDTVTAAQLRMKIGNEYFYSDTFLITRLPNPTTGYICGDSVLIYWNKIQHAASYQVYRLGEKYLEPLLITSDTTAIISKNNLSGRYIAIAPIPGHGVIAPKSYAFDYTTQGAGCFINAFYADINGVDARLALSLGTLINVVTISFEKQSANGYDALGNTAIVNQQLQYAFDYGPLKAGITYFRAKLTLAGGQIIYSDPQAVFYAPPGKYVLLPNPVNRDNNITVITPLPDGETIVLTDVPGRTVLRQEIIAARQFINTSGLQRGLYFYRIFKKGAQQASGKILVL